MNELALFAGAGGGILGSKLLGWRTVCAVEINDYCRRVLCARQDDGILEPFPIWDDVRTFDGKRWRGLVDVVSGGFPCQDISLAGDGAGIDGEASGLWREMSRIICEVGPRFVFVENSPALTSRGLDRVLGDLASMGFYAEWGVLSAADAIWSRGTPAVYHDRYRIWIIGKSANANGVRELQRERCISNFWGRTGDMGEEVSNGRGAGRRIKGRAATKCHWWAAEPGMGRVAHGVAHRVDRIRAIGNGQVPVVAATAWNLLS